MAGLFQNSAITRFNELEKFVNLKTISADCFSGCKQLTSVKLPIGLKTIGNNAFYECNALESINLPSTITEFGNSVLRGTKISLTSLPDWGVKNIGAQAFLNCKELQLTSLPEGTERVNYAAFNGCSKCNFKTLPSTLTSMYADVFKGTSTSKVKILNTASVIVLAGHSVPFDNGVIVYVPDALFDSYASAEGWSTWNSSGWLKKHSEYENV